MNIEQLKQQYPLVEKLIQLEPVAWFNPNITTLEEGLPYVGLNQTDVQEASDRLVRFAPSFAKPFLKPKKLRGF